MTGVIGLVAPVHWLAEASSGGPLPPEIATILSLLQVPVVGGVFVAMLRGWLVTGKEHDRVVTERDRERDERIAAQTALTRDVLPVLSSSQATQERVIRLLDEGLGRR